MSPLFRRRAREPMRCARTIAPVSARRCSERMSCPAPTRFGTSRRAGRARCAAAAARAARARRSACGAGRRAGPQRRREQCDRPRLLPPRARDPNRTRPGSDHRRRGSHARRLCNDATRSTKRNNGSGASCHSAWRAAAPGGWSARDRGTTARRTHSSRLRRHGRRTTGPLTGARLSTRTSTSSTGGGGAGVPTVALTSPASVASHRRRPFVHRRPAAWAGFPRAQPRRSPIRPRTRRAAPRARWCLRSHQAPPAGDCHAGRRK